MSNVKEIELYDKQIDFVYSKDTITVMLCGRMAGKSTAAAYLVVNRLTWGQSVLVVAPTYQMLKNSMISMTLKLLHMYGYRKNKHYSYNGSDHDLSFFDKQGNVVSKVHFRSGENFEAIRSVTDVHLLVLDEAALLDMECFEVAMACVRGKTVTNPQYFFATTPRGRANFVSTLCFEPGTKVIRATSYDNKNVAKASIDNLVRFYGEDFMKQEVFAEIIDSTSSGVFKKSDIDGLMSNIENKTGDIIFGFDIAAEGDDFSAIVVKQGNQILEIAILRTPDDESFVNFFQFMYSKYPGVKKVNIDKTGSGAGLLPSRLAGIFKTIEFIGVHFAQSPISNSYANARAEMYHNLRDEIRNNGLHFVNIDKTFTDMVELELLATEFKINSKRQLQLNSKDEIKKMISRSPDISDALALSCYDTTGIAKSSIQKTVKALSKPSKAFPNKKG